jgi:hypothetical protein
MVPTGHVKPALLLLPAIRALALFRPTGVPPRFSSFLQASPLFTSETTDLGIVYIRSLADKTLMSSSVIAALANTAEGALGLGNRGLPLRRGNKSFGLVNSDNSV